MRVPIYGAQTLFTWSSQNLWESFDNEGQKNIGVYTRASTSGNTHKGTLSVAPILRYRLKSFKLKGSGTHTVQGLRGLGLG